MFFVFVLSFSAPGVVPSKTNETISNISSLERCKEENQILYQVKYDMSKDLDNCTNYIQYLSDSKDKAESIQNEFSDYLEETSTKLSNCISEKENCKIMLDLRSNEVEEHRFYANAYENLYEETNKKELQVSKSLNKTRLVLEKCMKQNKYENFKLKEIITELQIQNDDPELEKCKIEVKDLKNQLQTQIDLSMSLTMCRLENSKLNDRINDLKDENDNLFDKWWQNEIVCNSSTHFITFEYHT